MLVVTRAHADIQFGGPDGPHVSVSTGDVVLIPPGVVHYQLDTSSAEFEVAGSYPMGFPDVAEIRGEATPEQLATISKVSMFTSDPTFGVDGAPWGAPDQLLVLPTKS